MAFIKATAVVILGLIFVSSSCHSASYKTNSNDNDKKGGMEEILPLMYMMMNGATPLNTPTVWLIATAVVTLALMTNLSANFKSV